jgi:hypothetical protein
MVPRQGSTPPRKLLSQRWPTRSINGARNDAVCFRPTQRQDTTEKPGSGVRLNFSGSTCPPQVSSIRISLMCDELEILRQEAERARELVYQAKKALRIALLEDPPRVASLHVQVEGAEQKLQHDLKALRLHKATHLDCNS